MRFISFSKNGREAVGVRLGNGIVDLSRAAPGLPASLAMLIEGQLLGEAEAAARASPSQLALDEIEFLPVIPCPSKIVGIGMNYRSDV